MLLTFDHFNPETVRFCQSAITGARLAVLRNIVCAYTELTEQTVIKKLAACMPKLNLELTTHRFLGEKGVKTRGYEVIDETQMRLILQHFTPRGDFGQYELSRTSNSSSSSSDLSSSNVSIVKNDNTGRNPVMQLGIAQLDLEHFLQHCRHRDGFISVIDAIMYIFGGELTRNQAQNKIDYYFEMLPDNSRTNY